MIAVENEPLVDVRHKAPPLKALTSIRFFAAMYVVLYHLQFGFNQRPMISHFMRSGYTGVTLFFVLSGFILAYNYPVVRSAREFWIARFARIYPVYFLSLVLMLVQPTTRHAPHLIAGCILDFTLTQAWWIPLSGAINLAAWTLSVEAFFYAVFPFISPWLRTVSVRKFALIQLAYTVLMCIPAVLSLTHFAAFGVSMANVIEGSLPIFRLNTFAVGVFVGARYATHKKGLLIPVSGSIALLCTAWARPLLPVRTLLLTYFFVWIIAELANATSPVLTNRWMQVAGEISYGIYILQFPADYLTYHLLIWLRFPANYLLGAYIIGTIALAYVSFRWLETPARLAIRRALTGRPVPVRAI